MLQIKKVEKNVKKLLTSDKASDIICKLTREGQPSKKEFEKKLQKNLKKVLDKRKAM